MAAFASGDWNVRQDAEADFVARWEEFLGWTKANLPGLQHAVLLKDEENDRHYISVAQWCCSDHRAAWRAHADFRPHLQACMALCDDNRSSRYTLAASVDADAPAGAPA